MTQSDAWNSFTNDDLLWKPSAGRIGGTLSAEKLPGSGNVSTHYFPETEARYIRLLLTSFPDEVTEFQFYGP